MSCNYVFRCSSSGNTGHVCRPVSSKRQRSTYMFYTLAELVICSFHNCEKMLLQSEHLIVFLKGHTCRNAHISAGETQTSEEISEEMSALVDGLTDLKIEQSGKLVLQCQYPFIPGIWELVQDTFIKLLCIIQS